MNVYVVVRDPPNIKIEDLKGTGMFTVVHGIFSTRELAQKRRQQLYDTGLRPETKILTYQVDP